MKSAKLLHALMSILLVISFSGCADLDPASPGSANTGSADFSIYVALGNSLTAGYQSGGLVDKYQRVSYPALIARAVGVETFAMPLISEPGIPPLMFAKSLSPVVLDTLDGQGVPLNTAYPGIYNNLGIPGATLNQILTAGPGDLTNPFFVLILRDTGLGANALEQALNLNPTFASVWIGSNDALGSVMMGSDQLMTSATSFISDYRELMDSLSAHIDGIIAANIPDVTEVPFTSTIATVLVDPITRDTIFVGGQTVPLLGEVQGQGMPLPPDAKVLLSAAPFIAQGTGIPVQFGGNGNALADMLILDPTEIANIAQRVQEFNTIIDTICANRSIPVVDIYTFLEDINSNGATMRGEHFTTDFLSGGLFSVDGIHLSTLGYYLIANEFIDKINQSFNASIPGAFLPALP